MNKAIPFPSNFTLYEPKLGFGKINKPLLQEIKSLASLEGFLTDPIYMAKLFTEAKEISKELEGNILINHSGGTLSLMGFLDKMKSDV